MTKLIVGITVKCIDLPEAVAKATAKQLTFKNPEYQEAIKFGRHIPPSLLPYNIYYSGDKDLMYVPKGYLPLLENELKGKGHKYTLKAALAPVQKLNLEFKGKLRDYQEEAVKAMLKYPYGFLDAKPASGKTVISCAIMAKRQRATLVVVHNKELLYQWQDRIKQFLDYDCGLVGDGKFIVKPVTVGIINTVSKRYSELQDKFNFLIADEAHRVMSPMWQELFFNMKAHYHMGMSGTAFRRDDLNKPIFYIIGPKLHAVDPNKLGAAVENPTIIKVQTPFQCHNRLDYTKKIKLLVEDPVRNKMLLRTIARDVHKHSSQGLFCSDRIAHCQLMADALNKKGIKSAVLSSKTPTKQRKQIVADVRSGKIKVLCSSFSLISEGFDVPNLSFLVLGCPAKFKGKVVQTISRICRPSEGAAPRLYDYRDNQVNTLMYSGFARDRIYKEMNWM